MERILQHKLILVTIAIQLVALPLVLFAVKERQETRTQASASTTLSFTPASTLSTPHNVDLGQEFPVNVVVTPSDNLITLVKLEIDYDSSKLKPSDTNPITVNSTAFPQIIEGPITSSPGKIQIVVSTGFDYTKVIQTETKVLTVNFKALAPVNQTQVYFTAKSELYSLANGDSSNVSVLSSTTPMYVKINAAPTPTFTPVPTNTPTPSPRPTSTPTPTRTPLFIKVTSPNGGETLYVGDTHRITWTSSPEIDKVYVGYSFGPGSLNDIPNAVGIPNTGFYDWKVGIGNTTNTQVKIDVSGYQTGIGAADDQSDNFFTVLSKPTSTPTPTNIPTAIPTLGKTSILFNGLKLHGLGKGGDSPNPDSSGTLNPIRTTRELTVELYDLNGNIVNTSVGNIKYTTPTEGVFNGSVELPNTILSGDYQIKIKTPYYLRKNLQGLVSIVKGQSNIAQSASTTVLKVGDINLDGKLSVLDYDVIIECYSDLQPAKATCDATKKLAADISDDGKVNQDDYNLFLRELSVQQGE